MYFKHSFFALTLGLLSLSLSSAAQSVQASKWADSVYQKLNNRERIAQMIMVAAYSGTKKQNDSLIRHYIKNRQIGGVIFMQGGPIRQARLTNEWQSSAQVPLLIAMDAEWGLGMRLDSVKNFPKQMQLGATQNPAFAYQIGASIAQQCKLLGVHINFGPVVDVNNNPNNPVINLRSYGEKKEEVARFSEAYIKGLQDNGVMACAKHFPGHGDTDADSHKELPVITKSKEALENVELYPFARVIASGVQSIMVGHLQVPALEPNEKLPSTLSPAIVTDLLKKEMNFKGLVITDALNMQGVANYYQPGEVDLKAFLAGNDILLFSQDPEKAINKIELAIKENAALATTLSKSVHKILMAKFQYGLAHPKIIETTGLTNKLNSTTDKINAAIAHQAITDVKGKAKELLSTAKNIHVICIHKRLDSLLEKSISQNSKINYHPKLELNNAAKLIDTATQAVVIAINGYSPYPNNNFGLSNEEINFLSAIQKNKQVCLAFIGNPYAIRFAPKANALLVTYESNIYTESAFVDFVSQPFQNNSTLPITPIGFE
jgi:beta-glucosidase-like glycosyl hydrolase